MSLKHVHLLFIAACLGLSLFMAQWALAGFYRQGAAAFLGWTAVALLSAIACGVYGWRFQRRCREWGV